MEESGKLYQLVSVTKSSLHWTYGRYLYPFNTIVFTILVHDECAEFQSTVRLQIQIQIQIITAQVSLFGHVEMYCRVPEWDNISKMDEQAD